jgi:hypothetical protein
MERNWIEQYRFRSLGRIAVYLEYEEYATHFGFLVEERNGIVAKDFAAV